MPEFASALLLGDAATAFQAAYWVCLIVGGGLLLLSALGGHHGGADVDAHAGLDFHADAEAGAGFHAEADAAAGDVHADLGAADAAHSALSLATWFSLRFVVFFMAIFGAVGVVLSYLTALGRGATLTLALLAGLLAGQGVHHLFRAVRRASGNSTPQPRDYVHRLGRVTIAIRPPEKGEVSIQVRDGLRYLPAVAAGGQAAFGVGDEVVVVAYRGGIAEVVSRRVFEQMRPA